jgi:hypothetical protein
MDIFHPTEVVDRTANLFLIPTVQVKDTQQVMEVYGCQPGSPLEPMEDRTGMCRIQEVSTRTSIRVGAYDEKRFLAISSGNGGGLTPTG